MRDNGGHLVALKWSMFNLYGVKPGEVWWCGSDIGWVVGHSYIVYGPLIHGATSIMYEGKPVGTPDAGAFWRVIAEHKAVALFTAPTAFRAIRKEDPDGTFIRKYDLSKFRTLFLAGERADPPTVEWAEAQLKVPVIDHWWQTETGWCIAGNPVGLGMLPVKHGSPTVPMPGYQVDVVDEASRPVPAGTMGSIVIKLPMPPACLPTLWQQDERFKEAYLTEFPGYYKTSDAGYKDEDGYVWVMGRTDDIINVAGHRLSTGGMEEILASHPDVAECAVLGIKDAIKGEVPCGFLVLKAGVTRAPTEIEKEIVALVRDKLGPVAAFKLAITVGRLPKTRSGKNPARHHQEDRRRRELEHAGHDRGPQGARRNRRRAEGQGVGNAGRVRSPAPPSFACQLSQQLFGDFLGELLSRAGNQHPFGIVRNGGRARHAVIEQSACATDPVAAFDRLVKGRPAERAAGVVAMAVLLRPFRAVFEQKTRQAGVAAEHREIER